MKQTFNIPEGCKVVTVEQIGNKLITSFEPEKYVPKVGDFVKIIYPSGNPYFCEVSDVKGYQIGSKNVVITPDGVAFEEHGEYFTYSSIEKITPEEFQAEFEKLGYVYVFETHTAHKKRWRAARGVNYYYVDSEFEADYTRDEYSLYDNNKYDNLNYFKTKEQAEAFAEIIKKEAINFHKNNQKSCQKL